MQIFIFLINTTRHKATVKCRMAFWFSNKTIIEFGFCDVTSTPVALK